MNFQSPITVATTEASADYTDLALRKTFLDSLHTSRSTVVHGTVGQSVSSLLFWYSMGDRFYFGVFIFAWIVCAGRLLYMKAYDFRKPFLMSDASTAADINRWKAFYMVGSASTSLVVGVLAGYSVFMHPESWACAVSLALALGMMISVIGRNHGSMINVVMVLVCMFLPIILAFVHYGVTTDPVLGFGFATLFIPFLISTKNMTFAVRQRFLEADSALMKADRLRQMFYEAISNMPDGLLVMTRTGDIKFATKNARRLFDVPDDYEVGGKKLATLLQLAIRMGAFPREQALRCELVITQLLNGATQSAVVRFRDDLFIEFSVGRDESKLLRPEADEDSFVMVCADVTARIKSADKVTYMANFDMLSELPNRRYMRELILGEHAAMRRGSWIAFCVFDVDKFKDINDTMGHASGDEVIRSVGRSMLDLRERRPDLIVSRLGGDEFVMALPNIDETFALPQFLDEAFSHICREYDILGKQVDVRCSGGVIVCSQERFQFDDAYTKADLALYDVKQNKRKQRNSKLRWKLFDDEMEMSFKRDQQARLELGDAIALDMFQVQYQPMFSPDGKRIETFEALSRWKRPGIGIVSPDEFIPIAESMNIVGDITKRVIERACMDCSTWGESISVSVNLSALDLTRYEIIDIISDALRNANLPASRLQVEITETVFLKDTDKAARILTSLHEMGVKTAIDDFGTGYSNLSYINKLPLDKVKIDKSFIRDIETNEKSQQLFEAVVSLGKKMKLGVIVEGVETENQLKRINEVGVDLIQGFIFGKPMDNDEAKDLISRTMRTDGKSNVIPMAIRT